MSLYQRPSIKRLTKPIKIYLMQSYSINHVESFHMFYLSHTRLEVVNINAQSCLKRLKKNFFEKNEKQKMSVVLCGTWYVST
jgi:hypothetical protein